MIGIIDYGVSNLKSVHNALNFVGAENEIFSEASAISRYDKLILPGVGAFGLAMDRLNKTGFSDAIRETVLIQKVPFLGICLGMQLILDSSTEKGFHKGLGLIQGEVKFLGDRVQAFPVPHVGWNEVNFKADFKLIAGMTLTERNFYFVHSFYCDLNNKEQVCATVHYDFEFDVGVQHENIFAFQFHPEKSQKNGLALLKNFSSL